MKMYKVQMVEDIFISLLLTIYLGILFLGFQICEYRLFASFDVDNIYGTVFYMLTLLHGLHVYIGLSLLLLTLAFYLSFPFLAKKEVKSSLINFFVYLTVWY